MTLPTTPKVEIRLGTGVGFGNTFILGDVINGVLGSNLLGTSAVQIVDVSSSVQRISIRRGRDRMFERYNPGDCTIRFLDTTGNWNPNNTLSPYYGQIKPMRQVRITTVYSGTTYSLFTGFIESWDWSWPDPSAKFAVVELRCTDAFRVLELANITTVTGQAAGQLPGTRIGLILDQAGWPSNLRSIDSGDTTLQADPGTERSALEAMQTIEETDLGGLFMDGDGKIVYLDRGDLSLRASGTATVFDDDGTDIAYQGLDIGLDETDLANQVLMQRVGGTIQIASDTASAADYFRRSYSKSGLMMETDDVALGRARSILAYRKDARIRVDSISLDLSTNSNRVVPGLSLRIGDPIQVRRQMAAGTVLDVRVTINGIDHDITPETWETRFSTAYPLSTAFLLGNSQFGILGTSTL